METLQQQIRQVVNELFNVEIEPELTRPAEQFGDYSTNVALQLAGKLGKNPREIAESMTTALRQQLGEEASGISVDGPGFINITLQDSVLAESVMTAVSQGETYGSSGLYANQVIVTEYSDPNPFKVLHAGHLYTSVVGDAISKLYEAAGAEVHRVNFGGDVGLHVGKTMWAIIRKLGGESPEQLNEVPENQRAEWMAEAYVEGTNAYEDDATAKAEIIALNKRVYELHDKQDHSSPFAKIYWTCRQWSYDYFNQFYERIGSKFEKFYPESAVTELGLKTVKEQIAKGVFEQSENAVVFRGEPHGLHTRVFINSEGIPTYEAKDVGLIMMKWNDYHFDKSVVITGNEQEQYMAVVLKAIEQFAPELANATTHITHGMVRLGGGQKMSSRKGNILRAVDVLDAAAGANRQASGKTDERVELGAVKYAFLSQRTGGDIVFDPQESVSLHGNSGPYLQYAHARARSILRKAATSNDTAAITDFDPAERSLARKISEYPEIVQKATAELMPHYICTYLYELAQTFNRFYEQSRVVDDPRQEQRLQLVKAYSQVLKNGLSLLNIAAPEQM